MGITNKDIIDKWMTSYHPRSISISGAHLKYLHEHKINLSRIVQKVLDKVIYGKISRNDDLDELIMKTVETGKS